MLLNEAITQEEAMSEKKEKQMNGRQKGENKRVEAKVHQLSAEEGEEDIWKGSVFKGRNFLKAALIYWTVRD